MKALTIRIPEETYDTLSRLALEDDRSVAKFVSRFLVLHHPTTIAGEVELLRWRRAVRDGPDIDMDAWPDANRGSDIDDPPPSGKS